jgi:hypothetical protein
VLALAGRLEAGETLADVVEEVDLAVLAVVDHVDPALDLLAYEWS